MQVDPLAHGLDLVSHNIGGLCLVRGWPCDPGWVGHSLSRFFLAVVSDNVSSPSFPLFLRSRFARRSLSVHKHRNCQNHERITPKVMSYRDKHSQRRREREPERAIRTCGVLETWSLPCLNSLGICKFGGLNINISA